MARHLFLGDMASWATDLGADEVSAGGLSGKHALFIPDATITFWTAQTGGSQITDLQDTLGNAITSVAADSSGEFPQIYGPDTDPDTYSMWADGNGGAGPRRKVVATDIGDTVNANGQSLDDVTSQLSDQATLLATSLGVVEYDSATSSWPTRPSDSRIYVWVGPSAPPVGAPYMQDGRDFWLQPNPVA